MYPSIELVDFSFGGIFKIFYLFVCSISNIIVSLPLMIQLQICTATFKSTIYVKLEPFTTFWEYILTSELKVEITNWW